MLGVDSAAARVVHAARGHAGVAFAVAAVYVADMSSNFGLVSSHSGQVAMSQIVNACERPAGNRVTSLSRCC